MGKWHKRKKNRQIKNVSTGTVRVDKKTGNDLKTDTNKKKNKVSCFKKALQYSFIRECLNVLLSLAMAVVLLVVFFFLIRLYQGVGKLNLKISDVSRIYDLTSASIEAEFIDDYRPYTNASICFTETVWLDSDVYVGYSSRVLNLQKKSLQAMDGAGNWLDVDKVEIKPIKDKGVISFVNCPDTLLYKIETGYTSGNNIHFDSYMSYKERSKDEYTYTITAPMMYYTLYCIPDEREYIEASITDSMIVLYKDDNIIGTGIKLRIPAYLCYEEEDIDKLLGSYGRMWYVGGGHLLFPFSLCGNSNNSSDIQFTFSPSNIGVHRRNNEHADTSIYVRCLKELDMKCTGEMNWRYGKAQEEKLDDDRLRFVVADTTIKDYVEDLYKTLTVDRHQISLCPPPRDPVFLESKTGYSTGGVINATFRINDTGDSRETSFSYNDYVSDVSLNSVNKLPNIGAFVTENWNAALIMTFLTYLLGKFTFFKDKESKDKQKS